MFRRPRVRHVVFAVLGGLAVVGIAVGWQAYLFLMPFHQRFERSEPALDAFAAKVSVGGQAVLATPPSRIGYFDILKAEPLPHGFVLQSNYGNPFDWNGFAYSTTPLPQYEYDGKGEIKQIFTPVRGCWYTVFRQ